MKHLALFALGVLTCSAPVTAQCGPPLTQELLPPDPQPSTAFGRSVAVRGDALVVGNEAADSLVGGPGFRGAVYVWRRNGASFAFEAKLPGFGPPSVQLGAAVAVDGDVLLASQFGSTIPYESARVFRRVGGVWSYEAQLVPADPVASNAVGVRSVAVDGDWAAVGHRTALGAPIVPIFAFTGAVYLYEHAAGVWTQREKLLPLDSTNGDQVGGAVAMRGGVLLFSSRAGGGMNNQAPAGRVHVYRIVAGAPVLEATLTTSVAGQLGNDFGHSLATDGTSLAIGDPNDTSSGASSGSVHVYRQLAGAWTPIGVVRPSLPSAGKFGATVAIEGDELFVSSATTHGVWHFRRLPSGQWIELGIGSVPIAASWSVDALCIDAGTLVAGSRNVYSQSGGAYVFDSGASPAVCTICAPKVTSTGCLPSMGWTGSTSLSAGSFDLTAHTLLPNRPGLFFYGAHGIAQAFQGGTLCVQTPLKRTPVQLTSSGANCAGAVSLDFDAWIASGVDPALVVGSRWAAQFWSRDPAASSGSSFTNTLLFTLLP